MTGCSLQTYLLRAVRTGATALLAICAACCAAQEPVRMFDFGTATSPVQPGWLGVHAGSAYDKAQGYGWGQHGPLRDTDKPQANDLERDFCLGYGGKGDLAAHFLVDLPDGPYTAAFFAGDLQYSRQEMPMDILVGQQLLVDAWRVSKWDCRVATFTVRGGQADFVFRSSPTDDKRYSFWLINAILIYPGSDPTLHAKALEQVGQIQDAWVLKDFKEQISEPEPDAAPVTDADRQRGYIAFARNPVKIVLPTTLPTAQERTAGLHAQATPGAYPHVTFGVVPLSDLGECAVTVSALQDGSNGIPASACTTYLARIARQRVGLSRSKVYRWQPKVLDPTSQAPLAAGQSRWWWLVLHVPEDQPAGLYRGTVTFKPGQGPPHSFPLTVRVWPFKLRQPPGEVFGMYWGRRYVLYPDTIPQQFADLREHGCNGITLDIGPQGGWEADGSLKLDFTEMDQILKLAMEHGLTSPIPWNGASRFRGMVRDPLDSDVGKQKYKQIVAAVADHARQAGWPPLLFYPCDEPPKEEILRYLPLIKEVPQALTYCTPNKIAVGLETVPWMDFACWQHRSANDETRAATLKAGKQFWYYSSNYGEDPLTARMRSGFLRWRLGATGMYYWHYQAPHGDPYNCLDSTSTDHCVAYPTPQGPIPSLGWEGQRAGIDDYKYVRMLQWAIAQAEPNDPRAQAAQKTLDELHAAIPGDGLQVLRIPEAFTLESFEHYRRAIAEHIAALLEAR